MAAIVSFAHSIGTRLVIWLVGKHGVPYVLAGTLAAAIVGAAAVNQPPAGAQSPSSTTQASQTPNWQPYHQCDEGR